jgi:GPI mannosyltransferase 1 subunit M
MVWSDYRIQLLLLSSIVVRLAFVFYGDWQDRTMEMQYSDVDYKVFSDAAIEVFHGQSPFNRATYRYSPFLAWLLLPNVYFPMFGKLLFSFFDVVVVACIIQILAMKKESVQNIVRYSSTFALNYLTINVSTRGNCDSIVSVLLALCLLCVFQKRYLLSGLLFGISVHFRIFPIIFSLAFFLFIEAPSKSLKKNRQSVFWSWIYEFFNVNRLLFVGSCLMSFSSLTYLGYLMYGDQCIYESMLYHLVRSDNRHNFSFSFYPIYFNWTSTTINIVQKLMTFLPQILSLFVISLKFYKNLPVCLFFLSFTFVTFNKVITAQYFYWYLTFYPFLLPGMTMKSISVWIVVAIWGIIELSWNFWAFWLELRAQNTFLLLFLASCLFFVCNLAILLLLISTQRSSLNEISRVDEAKKRVSKKKYL